MITIIDYGLGNINAFGNVYKRLHIPFRFAGNASELETAQRLILPGVGSFDYAMKKLNESGMRNTLDELVLGKKVPVIGVCVGMQIMANKSEEGVSDGLGWIKGLVKKIDSSTLSSKTHLPHMGWNDVEPDHEKHLFKDFDKDIRFYFLHSYCFHCQNDENSIATAMYGEKFTCAIHSDNIWGVQFHPEKSHHWGAMVLKNFAELSIC